MSIYVLQHKKFGEYILKGICTVHPYYKVKLIGLDIGFYPDLYCSLIKIVAMNDE